MGKVGLQHIIRNMALLRLPAKMSVLWRSGNVFFAMLTSGGQRKWQQTVSREIVWDDLNNIEHKSIKVVKLNWYCVSTSTCTWVERGGVVTVYSMCAIWKTNCVTSSSKCQDLLTRYEISNTRFLTDYNLNDIHSNMSETDRNIEKGLSIIHPSIHPCIH